MLEAAVRSFPPLEPIVLRWKFPLWVPDDKLNPERLEGAPNKGRRKGGQPRRRV